MYGIYTVETAHVLYICKLCKLRSGGHVAPLPYSEGELRHYRGPAVGQQNVWRCGIRCGQRSKLPSRRTKYLARVSLLSSLD